MFKRILVPLDGSDLAEIALPYTEEIACYLNSDVTLIHVAESEDDAYNHMHRVYMDNTVEITRQNLQKFQKKRGEKLKDPLQTLQSPVHRSKCP